MCSASVALRRLCCVCAAVICLFALVIASDESSLGVGGASITARESLLRSLQSQLMPLIRDALLSMELKEMCGKVGFAGIVEGKYCLRHTKVESLDFLQSSKISITPVGIELQIDFWQLRVKTDFEGSLRVMYITRQQSGTLAVNLHRPNSLTVKVMLHSDGRYAPTVTVDGVAVDLPLPTVEATGDMRLVLDLWNKFAETIWNAVTKGIRETLKPTIESAANEALKTMKWSMPLDELIFGHFWLSSDIEPSWSRGTVSAYSVAYFSPQKGTALRPKKVPIRLPNAVESSDANVEVDVSDFTLSYLVAAYAGAGALSFTVRDRDLPREFPIRLTTTFFRSVIPALYERYPNREMLVIAEPSESPVVDVAEGGDGVRPAVSLRLAAYVIVEPGRSEKVFVLEVKTTAGLSPSMSSEGSQLRLSGRISLAEFAIREVESQIGAIPVASLERLIGGTLKNVVVPLLNVALSKGVLLPNHIEIPLLDTSRGTYSLAVSVTNAALKTRRAYASAAAFVKTDLKFQRK